MNLGPTLVTLGAILGKKSHFYGLKSPIFVTIWSLRTNIEIYIKIDFYLMNEIFGGFPFEEKCTKLGGFNSGSLVFSYILVCQKIECPFFVLSAQFDRD